MGRVSQALQGHLHSIFDTQAAPVLALRVRHPAGARWSISDETLTLIAGDNTLSLELREHTLGSLASALTTAGFDVVYLHSAVSHLAATTLLTGQGDQGDSNGDHLTIFTAPLAVLLDAWGLGLGEGQAAIAAALAQMILPQATQEWADLFGEIFGIPRIGTVAASPYRDLARLITRYNPAHASGLEAPLYQGWEQFFTALLGLTRAPGESAAQFHARLLETALQRPALALPPLEIDAAYTARIMAEVQRARGSPPAIAHNIQRSTEQAVQVREPWQEVLYLSDGALSADRHLQGAGIYEYHIVQLVARRGLNWTPVLREAEADRPAGTWMLPPATHLWPFLCAMEDITSQLGRVWVWAEELKWHAYGCLSVDLVLSHYVPPPPCHVGRVAVKALWSRAGLRGPYEYYDNDIMGWFGDWDDRSWHFTVERPIEMYPPHSTVIVNLVTEDGVYLVTEDGKYLAVPLNVKLVTEDGVYLVTEDGKYLGIPNG